MERIKRPRVPPPEETDVVSVSTSDARRILEAAEDWQELLCVTTALYLGARRAALARIRRRDRRPRARNRPLARKGTQGSDQASPGRIPRRPPCGRRRRRLARSRGLPHPEPSPSGCTRHRTIGQGRLGDDPSACGAGGGQSSRTCTSGRSSPSSSSRRTRAKRSRFKTCSGTSAWRRPFGTTCAGATRNV